MTVLGVIISTAMVTAVLVSYTSIVELMKKVGMAQRGNGEFAVTAPYDERIEALCADPVFKSYALKANAEFFSENENEGSRGASIIYNDAQNVYNIKVLSGTFPQKDGEVAINEQLHESGVNIGDTYKTEFANGKISGVVTAVVTNYYAVIDRWVDKVALHYQEPAKGDVTEVICAYESITKASVDYSKQLAQSIYQGDPEVYFSPLYGILRYYNISDGSSLLSNLTILKTIAGIAIVIVIIASVLMIYNSFSISTAERRKMLGMLSSIGATPWQKKGFIFFEATLVGGIGIPIGLISGVVGISITLSFLSKALATIFEIEAASLVTSLNWQIILYSAIFSIITLIISAFLPSITASRVSPIEAVRNIGAVKYKSRSTKGLMRTLFGFEGKLAEISMKRNYRRYLATLLSLTAAVVLLICALGPVNMIEQSYKSSIRDNSFNMNTFLMFKNADNYKEAIKPYQALSDQGEVYYERLYIYANANAEYSDIFTKNTLKLVQEMADPERTTPQLKIIAIPDAEYEKLSGDSAQNSGSCVVLNKLHTSFNEKTYALKNSTKLKQGDEILGTLGDNPIRLKVASVSNEMLNAAEEDFKVPSIISLAVSQKTADALISLGEAPIDVGFYFKASGDESTNDIYQKINEIKVPDGVENYSNTISGSDQAFAVLLIIKVFTLGFVCLIALVSATNISNTVYTSVLLNKRELAMIKSVGLEQARVNKMVLLEGVIYAIKALIIGLPIGIAIYLLEFIVLRGMAMTELTLPFGAIALACILVAIVTVISSLPALSTIKNTPITELLRTENE